MSAKDIEEQFKELVRKKFDIQDLVRQAEEVEQTGKEIKKTRKMLE